LFNIDFEKVLKYLLDMDKILGFGFSLENPILKEVVLLGKERFALKQNKQYEKADLIRKQIEDKGYYLEESKEYFVINRYHG
jgi:cysteinyl-tRNA synthetase